MDGLQGDHQGMWGACACWRLREQLRVLSGTPNMKEDMMMEEFKYYFVDMLLLTEDIKLTEEKQYRELNEIIHKYMMGFKDNLSDYNNNFSDYVLRFFLKIPFDLSIQIEKIKLREGVRIAESMCSDIYTLSFIDCYAGIKLSPLMQKIRETISDMEPNALLYDIDNKTAQAFFIKTQSKELLEALHHLDNHILIQEEVPGTTEEDVKELYELWSKE
jgi:hypothetical protein